MLGIFKSKEKSSVQYSKFFPEKFYTNRMVKLDDSLEYFIKNSSVTFPKDALLVKDINKFNIDNDGFEEVTFVDSDYKLWYDITNDIFFLLQYHGKQKDDNSIDSHEITFENKQYLSWTGSMNVFEKEMLLSIFNKRLSEESDEYLFLFLDNYFYQHNYAAIVVQPSMIS